MYEPKVIKMSREIALPPNFDFSDLEIGNDLNYHLEPLQIIAMVNMLPDLLNDLSGLTELLIGLLYDRHIDEGRPRIDLVERVLAESGGVTAISENISLFKHPEVVFAGGFA